MLDDPNKAEEPELPGSGGVPSAGGTDEEDTVFGLAESPEEPELPGSGGTESPEEPELPGSGGF